MLPHFKARTGTAKLPILDSFRCHRSILTQWCFASSNRPADGRIRLDILADWKRSRLTSNKWQRLVAADRPQCQRQGDWQAEESMAQTLPKRALGLSLWDLHLDTPLIAPYLNHFKIQVALQKSTDGKLFCSGTLISDTKVLLAAQCLEA
jgi:hypothetical protein